MSKTVTLHCQTGNHPWERVSIRGRRPANCPKHGGTIILQESTTGLPARPQVEVSEDDVRTLKLPRNVIAAFRAAGVEPPRASRVDRIGYTPAQGRILDRFYS